MKQSLQLKLGQNLTMTPQLQQAVKLLQLSTLELELEVRQALESNTMLEFDDESNDSQNETDNETTENDMSKDLSMDTDWEDFYPDRKSPSNHHLEPHNIEDWHAAEWSLQDHLLWQLNLTPFSNTDKIIAHMLIDAIHEDGYLRGTLEDIQQSIPSELDVELDEIEAVLHRIQQFDPVAVGARDLKECLLIQIKQLPIETPFLSQCKKLVQYHLHLLGQKNFQQLKSKMKVSDATLHALISLLQQLHPKPGYQINQSKSEYIIPDVTALKKNGKWIVKLNKDYSSHLRINPSYKALIKRADTSRDNQFLQEQLSEAKWFLKSLQHRNETLLRVAEYVVLKQQEFLEHGPIAMKPLTLQDVALSLSMHESTISRITTQKFLNTPRGIFELKYFFSSHLNLQDGGVTSSTAIKAYIKSWIENENSHKPLSDSQLTEMLSGKGIVVARRTIAKYREAMAIPPSHQRKSFANT